MVGLARAGHPAGTGPTRVLLAGIHLPPAIGVGPCIERMLQQILSGHTVGPPPLPCPLGRPLPQPYPYGDVVLPEIAQQGMKSPQLVKLPKEQAHHVLALCIGIIDHLTSRVVDIANRQRKAQRSPARLFKVP
jgi:hypothetical protein